MTHPALVPLTQEERDRMHLQELSDLLYKLGKSLRQRGLIPGLPPEKTEEGEAAA